MRIGGRYAPEALTDYTDSTDNTDWIRYAHRIPQIKIDSMDSCRMAICVICVICETFPEILLINLLINLREICGICVRLFSFGKLTRTRRGASLQWTEDK